MNLPVWLIKLLARSRLARWLPPLRRRAFGAEGYLHLFSDRLLSAPLAELTAIGELREAHAHDVIDLALPTPRFEVVPSLNTRQPQERRGTPPASGSAELREAIAEYERASRGANVHSESEILVTHGAAGAFASVADTLINPGDKAVVFDPCSPLFSLMLRHRRAAQRRVPAWQENGRLRFQFSAMAQALRGAKLFVFCDPCNPTGATIADEDKEQLGWWADRFDVVICEDHTFRAFGGDTATMPMSSIPNAVKRTISLGSVSASHALAAARVGWLTGPAPLVAACGVSQHLTAPFVQLVSQQQAAAALRMNPDVLREAQTDIASNRRYGLERLQSLSLHAVEPSSGYFVWLPVHELGMNGRKFAEELLRSKKVLVTPGDLFGLSGRQYVRLSVAGDTGRLREGLSRLGEFVTEVRWSLQVGTLTAQQHRSPTAKAA